MSDIGGSLHGTSSSDALVEGAWFVGDVSGDGRTDIALLGWSNGQHPAYVVPGLAMSGADDEVGHVTTATLSRQDSRIAVVLPAGDVDSDGRGDLWVVEDSAHLVLGTASGAVDLDASTVTLEAGAGSRPAGVAADLDGDGIGDLVLSTDEAAMVFRGPFSVGTTGAAAALLRVTSSAVSAPIVGVDVGDLDGDGHPDLVVGGSCGEAHQAQAVMTNSAQEPAYDGVPYGDIVYDGGTYGSNTGFVHVAYLRDDGAGAHLWKPVVATELVDTLCP